MLKINKDVLIKEESIERVSFEKETYFVIDDVAKYLKEDLSDVIPTVLPVRGLYLNTATIEQIEKGRKKEELSEFNKALLKGKHFKK